MKTLLPERRKSARTDTAARARINLLHPDGTKRIEPVNISEGGLCVRLQDALEVRSLVRLEWMAELEAERAVQVTGRVAWVIQRLDLRTRPPFLYDVGIEFVDAPALLRGIAARPGTRAGAAAGSRASLRALPPVTVRGRQFVPHLTREPDRSSPWHLIVQVEHTPCFSGRYASERAAGEAWKQFLRQAAKRKTK